MALSASGSETQVQEPAIYRFIITYFSNPICFQVVYYHQSLAKIQLDFFVFVTNCRYFLGRHRMDSQKHFHNSFSINAKHRFGCPRAINVDIIPDVTRELCHFSQ